MAIRIKDTTREYLCSVPLPVHADTYTVISHESVMDYAVAQLVQAGFTIQDESYRCTADGNIAQGIYYLNHQGDDELGMMFAWANSYNKQMRFKCAIGGYVYTSLSSMFASDMSVWGRKHTGSADAETIETISNQIAQAQFYFSRLVADKAIMKNISITPRKCAELLGVLFAEYEILTTEQMSFVKGQMEKPLYYYNATGTLWEFYNHVILALKKSHPRDWMEDQRKLHWFLAMEYDFTNFYTLTVPEVVQEEIVDSLANNYGQPANQTNLLTQIAEIEAMTETEEIAPVVETESILQYTDEAGNTFEAPVVEPCVAHEFEPTPEELEFYELSEESIPEEVAAPVVAKPDFDFDLSLDDDEEDAPVGDFFL